MAGRTDVSNIGVAGVYRTYKIDASTITYDASKAGGSSQAGLAVTLSGDDTVALCADGDAVLGKLILVEGDNKCNVMTEGTMTLPGGASATLTLMGTIVGALGASSAKGYIRSAASGTAAELVKARGRIENNDTTTAVVVTL